MPLRRDIPVLAAAAACVWLLSSCAAPGHGGSPTVLIEDRAYDIIRRLDAAGLVQSSVIGSRTLGRKEIARCVLDAQRRLELLGPGLGEAFDTLYDIYLPEILAGHVGLDHIGAEHEFRIERLDWSFVHTDGPVSPAGPAGYAPPEDVSGFNDYGRVDTGSGLRITPRAHWRLGRRALLTLRPEFTIMTDNPPENEIALLEGNLRLFAGSLELELGTDSLWWGPGRHGSLLVSNNAPPFKYMWKLGTHEPVLMPGWLSKLGPTSFTVFGARLDDRPGRDPWLGGMRLEFRIRPSLTLGLSRTAIMGGEHSGPTDLGLVWDVLIAKDENAPGGGPGDQKAGIDVRYRNARFRQPFEVYFEFEGEDQANWKPSRPAYLAGLYLPSIGGSTMLDLLVEYATTHVPGHEDYYYTHTAFDFERGGETFPAYTYDGFWMGHHMGTDADDLFVKLGFTAGRAGAGRFEIAYDRERRHLSGVTAQHPAGVETKDEWIFRFLWDYAAKRTLSLTTRFQKWRNFDDTPGEVRHASRVEIKLTFRY